MEKVEIKITCIVDEELADQIRDWEKDRIPGAYMLAKLQQQAKEINVSIEVTKN